MKSFEKEVKKLELGSLASLTRLSHLIIVRIRCGLIIYVEFTKHIDDRICQDLDQALAQKIGFAVKKSE